MFIVSDSISVVGGLLTGVISDSCGPEGGAPESANNDFHRSQPDRVRVRVRGCRVCGILIRRYASASS